MTKRTILRKFSLGDLESGLAGPSETRADAPAGPDLGPDFWAKAKVVMPGGKTSVHLRLDTEVYDWFKAQGRGHLTRMNAVLKSYVEAQGIENAGAGSRSRKRS